MSNEQRQSSMTLVPSKEVEAKALELALLGDDLSKLSAEQRLYFYRQTCESLGLNPLTKPFSYLELSGKLTLYAKKDCTDQLRKIHGVSITRLERQMIDNETYVVTAYAKDREGREDAATGAVHLGQSRGEMRANLLMKAETKAKRRVTLSICGLGMLDETEVEDIPTRAALHDPEVPRDEQAESVRKLQARWRELELTKAQVKAILRKHNLPEELAGDATWPTVDPAIIRDLIEEAS